MNCDQFLLHLPLPFTVLLHLAFPFIPQSNSAYMSYTLHYTHCGSNLVGSHKLHLVNKNVVLLELGGNENTITEVLNTIEIISTIIKEHINETGI